MPIEKMLNTAPSVEARQFAIAFALKVLEEAEQRSGRGLYALREEIEALQDTPLNEPQK